MPHTSATFLVAFGIRVQEGLMTSKEIKELLAVGHTVELPETSLQKTPLITVKLRVSRHHTERTQGSRGLIHQLRSIPLRRSSSRGQALRGSSLLGQSSFAITTANPCITG
jgi:hypothetical protein